ncbi:alpha-2,8-sialyltransferase 8F-like isoform X1 [Synchiropus splendidus]|uniref:alpha-2,8-sialyltransferase 8F-like isoform X1 n=2 Tax=Synchiropus splendidus TaxID=270530 RepID=UPI00237DF0CC|nr:alpha-2,8-sialyltransferase 8F-like isoform X1 [Synchiropus splendidus]
MNPSMFPFKSVFTILTVVSVGVVLAVTWYMQSDRKLISDTLEMYSRPWRKQQEHLDEFRSLLREQCNGSEDAIVTKANSPENTRLTLKRVVSRSFFNILPWTNPFSKKTWDTCSVVGNGGILFDSHCGKEIDSADFVIRCNLPPLNGNFKTHVGNKSSLVTANPSIFKELSKLGNYSQRLAERIKTFGDAIIAFPDQTHLVFKSINILRALKSPSRPVFLHPKYLSKLTDFWRSRGVKAARLSSGFFMVSMALELCRNVHVYGFWPLSVDPFGLYYLSHHYYDNRMPKRVHKMSAEFQSLLQLHVQGVIRLHLGSCEKPSS